MKDSYHLILCIGLITANQTGLLFFVVQNKASINKKRYLTKRFMVCEAGEDECGFFVFEWFVFDWLVFDGMFFLERIFFRRMVCLYADGTKKDPGFVFETGVFVWQERQCSTFFFEHLTNG